MNAPEENPKEELATAARSLSNCYELVILSFGVGNPGQMTSAQLEMLAKAANNLAALVREHPKAKVKIPQPEDLVVARVLQIMIDEVPDTLPDDWHD